MKIQTTWIELNTPSPPWISLASTFFLDSSSSYVPKFVGLKSKAVREGDCFVYLTLLYGSWICTATLTAFFGADIISTISLFTVVFSKKYNLSPDKRNIQP